MRGMLSIMSVLSVSIMRVVVGRVSGFVRVVMQPIQMVGSSRVPRVVRFVPMRYTKFMIFHRNIRFVP